MKAPSQSRVGCLGKTDRRPDRPNSCRLQVNANPRENGRPGEPRPVRECVTAGLRGRVSRRPVQSIGGRESVDASPQSPVFADCANRVNANAHAMGRLPPAIRGLLLANVIVFVVTYLIPDMQVWMVGWFALWFPQNEHFAIWQFATSMFMHGGITHILFNMFAVFSFGMVLEQLWGARRLLVFYFACGIGAAVIYTLVNWMEFRSIHAELVAARVPTDVIDTVVRSGRVPGPIFAPDVRQALLELATIYHAKMVGASGAVYGILVAFGLMFPDARLALLFLPVPIPAKYFVPILLAFDLLGGITGVSLFGGNIAHFAHIGGALIGFLLMWHWRNRARRQAAPEAFERPF